jgi:type IV pilus assembly protein PilW
VLGLNYWKGEVMDIFWGKHNGGCAFSNSRGYTLVELMVVVGLSALVMAGVYTIYEAQQKSFTAQDQVVEMQQNGRVALDIMEREIRLAGYDPDPNGTGAFASAAITVARAGQISFTCDLNDDNDVLDLAEAIDFGFSDALNNDADPNRNGLPDKGGVLPLGRRIGGAGGYQPIADNIEAVGFAYAYDNNSDGLLDVNPAGMIIWAIPDGAGGWIDLDTDIDGDIDVNDAAPGNTTGAANPAQLLTIRAVRIWVLARTGRVDRDYDITAGTGENFKVGANIITPQPIPLPDNVHFRRTLLSITVKCRNMGL